VFWNGKIRNGWKIPEVNCTVITECCQMSGFSWGQVFRTSFVPTKAEIQMAELY
jgi:hypothetical protein